MPGSQFKQAVREATGSTWEHWAAELGKTVGPLWSHEQIRNHLIDERRVSAEWAEWLATMYGQLMGRTPTGVTKDAGVQIGVRKTVAMSVAEAWQLLLSPEGLALWIGTMDSLPLQVGHSFESKEGVSGKITVVEPLRKLRMTWKRPEWDEPSRLQLYVLAAKSGKTTIALHQEMLEDVYMRDIMKRFWDDVLTAIQNRKEAVR
ncbi:SRPBCC domain-containing protein [Paenibacillus hodogayensis]|uniref:SRPBCC domain-containing protein n=1 Tax=Paenibacillus hodogayensis TaxID=279208 RepID=A0ABV5W456_9BACL